MAENKIAILYLSSSNHGKGVNKCLKSGCYEDKHTRPMAEAAKKYLEPNGFEVHIAKASMSVKNRCKEADKLGADWYFPFHTNAFKDASARYLLFMCIKTNDEYKKMVNSISKHVEAIYPGKKEAVFKAEDGLIEINTPKAKTVYCEWGFHTNKTDVEKFIHNPDAIGKAFAKAVCDYYGVKFKEPTTSKKKTTTKTKYKTNSYAKKIKTGLKKLGYYDGPINNYVTPEYTEAVLKFQKKVFKRDKDKDGVGGPDTWIAVQTFVNFIGIKYFEPEEVRCNCGHCTGYPAVIDKQLMKNVDYLRKDSGEPITITSGMRCKWKNDNTPGSSPTSKHMKAKALDLHSRVLTSTKTKRSSLVKRWYGFKGANYAYANTPGMGNAVHVDVK